MTSHAAVVARGMGKPCVAGCEGLDDRRCRGTVTIGGHKLQEGDIDHDRRRHRPRDRRRGRARPAADQRGLRDDSRLGGRRAPSARCARTPTTPADSAKAREFGAEGIGLCRTEHMFFGDERLPVVQEMILADDEHGRRDALERLLPFQQSDFEAIFEVMAGLPVTIRLLDPPLHEFLPPLEEATDERMRSAHPALQRVEPDARARAAAGSGSCGRRSTRCRCARSRARRRPCTSAPARRRSSRSCIPLVGFTEELRRLRELTEAVDGARRRRSSSTSAAR